MKNTAPFAVEVTGEVSNEKFAGKFVVKTKLSHRDRLIVDQKHRELLGDAAGEASPRALSTAHIISQLFVRIVEAPAWWTASDGGLDLEDDDVLAAVYEKAIGLDEREAARLRKEAELASKSLSEAVKP